MVNPTNRAVLGSKLNKQHAVLMVTVRVVCSTGRL